MRATVTGGGGFLGQRIVELLRARGDDVRVVARRRHPAVEALGATVIAADVRDAAALRPAFEHADVVLHVAGKTGFWGSRSAFWSVNVDGTRTVLDAARGCGVPRLVYTSTPSVVGYARDVENGGPELPYAAVHESAYAASKCRAEQLVLAANGSDIATVALRPHLIIGPGDHNLMPRVVRRAARGGLRVVGNGRNRVDLTYIDNAAWAHLDAADALSRQGASCAGKSYFISNGQPVVLWDWLNQLLAHLDLPGATRSVSFRAAYLAGGVAEALWRVLPLGSEPPITRFLAGALARSHWYDIAPAQRDLGYRVRVSMDEATQRTERWLADGLLRADAPRRWAADRRAAAKERPDYYITPTHDFTQYTKDYEEKYWNRDSAFDWQQDVPGNLKEHLERLPREEFARIAALALPLVQDALQRSIGQIQQHGLPMDEDALRGIRETLPADLVTIDRALRIQSPLEHFHQPVAQLQDRVAILKREAAETGERQRLGLFKQGIRVRSLATEAERREQAGQLLLLTEQIDEVQRAISQIQARGNAEREQLQASIGRQLGTITGQVLADLRETRELVRRALQAGTLPEAPVLLGRLRDLVFKRQVRGLKDIANHALVVEQSAIAPLTMGIIHYKRRREIQEAMTTFVNDEAKHSAVFRRFLAQKLEAKEHISAAVITGGHRYMWLARFLPSGGIFLAVIVEAIGAAFLEFFGDEAHMPDLLFRSICKTIAERDEQRHMDLCAATYNELYRRGGRWERLRNGVALRAMMKAAYGDKTESHPLLHACRAFGMESEQLYQHIAGRLSQQLVRVGVYVPPEELLGFMHLAGRSPASRPRRGGR